jgi:hypothetical protein
MPVSFYRKLSEILLKGSEFFLKITAFRLKTFVPRDFSCYNRVSSKAKEEATAVCLRHVRRENLQDRSRFNPGNIGKPGTFLYPRCCRGFLRSNIDVPGIDPIKYVHCRPPRPVSHNHPGGLSLARGYVSLL